MRMITACFAGALKGWTSRICVHVLLTFQEVMPISKTRNQLIFKTRLIILKVIQETARAAAIGPKSYRRRRRSPIVCSMEKGRGGPLGLLEDWGGQFQTGFQTLKV